MLSQGAGHDGSFYGTESVNVNHTDTLYSRAKTSSSKAVFSSETADKLAKDYHSIIIMLSKKASVAIYMTVENSIIIFRTARARNRMHSVL